MVVFGRTFHFRIRQCSDTQGASGRLLAVFGNRCAFCVLGMAPLLFGLLSALPAPLAAGQNFKDFISELWPEAKAFGISKPVFDRAFKGMSPQLNLPDLVIPGRKKGKTPKQAEFTRPPEKYLDARYLARLAKRGRVLAKRYDKDLTTIEREFGVDRYSVLAIFGRETAFGSYTPKHDAIRVLATQAYLGRRKEKFRQELLFALKLLQKGVPRSKMRASWAGAMGLTQFLPSEFFQHTHDMGDDGYADLFSSVPDALASAARQLKNKGWVRGQTWGYEIIIPTSSDCSLEGPPGMRPLRSWIKDGYRRVKNKKFPTHVLDAPAYLMSPAGTYGPSFLVLENFQVIRRYNTSDLYATFVGNLADRIAGGGDFVTKWKNIGRQRTEIIRGVQQGLMDAGYDIKIVDGFIGSGTRRQVGLYQKANGLRIDCWPGPSTLKHLRSDTN